MTIVRFGPGPFDFYITLPLPDPRKIDRKMIHNFKPKDLKIKINSKL